MPTYEVTFERSIVYTQVRELEAASEELAENKAEQLLDNINEDEWSLFDEDTTIGVWKIKD